MSSLFYFGDVLYGMTHKAEKELRNLLTEASKLSLPQLPSTYLIYLPLSMYGRISQEDWVQQAKWLMEQCGAHICFIVSDYEHRWYEYRLNDDGSLRVNIPADQAD